MDLSAGTLFASLFVGAVGFGIFLYGKKQMRVPQVVVGLVLMVYPYLVPDPAWMLGIGAALIATLWLAVRGGM